MTGGGRRGQYEAKILTSAEMGVKQNVGSGVGPCETHLGYQVVLMEKSRHRRRGPYLSSVSVTSRNFLGSLEHVQADSA